MRLKIAVSVVRIRPRAPLPKNTNDLNDLRAKSGSLLFQFYPLVSFSFPNVPRVEMEQVGAREGLGKGDYAVVPNFVHLFCFH